MKIDSSAEAVPVRASCCLQDKHPRRNNYIVEIMATVSSTNIPQYRVVDRILHKHPSVQGGGSYSLQTSLSTGWWIVSTTKIHQYRVVNCILHKHPSVQGGGSYSSQTSLSTGWWILHKHPLVQGGGSYPPQISLSTGCKIASSTNIMQYRVEDRIWRLEVCYLIYGGADPGFSVGEPLTQIRLTKTDVEM